ncbi:hypothetical protein PIB30_039928 [Stylosanthes scabra]|uniref:DUF1771 domain-containing protein n=1 Tax=Stylosanthes scabra TaxID=79078 RepID=A0ABU6RF41_9FABA|nr:hypothetical protein [Stylosanthes scabra]
MSCMLCAKSLENEDDENSYNMLHRVVRENWATMKEYYRAAVDAFAKGDYARADRLMEQGHFYNRMSEWLEKQMKNLYKSFFNLVNPMMNDINQRKPFVLSSSI